MDGIDMEKGLKVVSGNRALYIRLLGKFSDMVLDAELRQAVEAGDMAEAREKAHAIKGTSANLGLEAVRSAAIALEQHLKAGQTVSPTDALLVAVEDAYAQTRASIQEIQAQG